MGYSDSLLADGEVIARQTRQHWLALVLESRAAIAVWILAALLFVASAFFEFSDANISNIVGIIVLVLVVLGLLLFAYRWLQWINQAYIITNRRILKVEGIVNKRSADSSLEKINDLRLEENLIGRMLGYGDLDIITAADTAIDRFRMINDAKEFKRMMLDQKHRLESGEDIRMPGPPLMAREPERDTAAPMPPAPEPAPAPGQDAAPAASWQTVPEAPFATSRGSSGDDDPPSSPESAAAEKTASGLPDGPEDEREATSTSREGASPAPVAAADGSEPRDAEEITQTLARLADLRDRGAITVEEYEAKKTDLLSRL